MATINKIPKLKKPNRQETPKRQLRQKAYQSQSWKCLREVLSTIVRPE